MNDHSALSDKPHSFPSQDNRPGWRLAAVTGGNHLQRILEMYQEMGFETMIEEVNQGSCDNCTICYQESGEAVFRVYSRPKSEPVPNDIKNLK